MMDDVFSILSLSPSSSSYDSLDEEHHHADDDDDDDEGYLTADEFSMDQDDSGSTIHPATTIQDTFHLWHETKLLLSIALPAVAVQFSVLFIFPQTASVVGRTLGTQALAGFSLGSLVGNLTCLSVLVGALTAADTLMPRAVSLGDFVEIGRLAVRALILCSILLLIPVVPLCTVMEHIFIYLGQEKEASHLAAQWIKVYLTGVPAMLLFRVLQSFLNAQHQVWHLVMASTISAFLIHPCLLKIFIPMLGFLGSSLAIAVTQFVMAILLILFLRMYPTYHSDSWPQLSKDYFLEAMSPKPMLAFLSLSLGGVLSLSVCFNCVSFVHRANTFR